MKCWRFTADDGNRTREQRKNTKGGKENVAGYKNSHDFFENATCNSKRGLQTWAPNVIEAP